MMNQVVMLGGSLDSFQLSRARLSVGFGFFCALMIFGCRTGGRVDAPAGESLTFVLIFDGGTARHSNLALKRDLPASARKFTDRERLDVALDVSSRMRSVRDMPPFSVLPGGRNTPFWATRIFITGADPIMNVAGQLAHYESDYGDGRKDDEILIFDRKVPDLIDYHYRLALVIAHEIGHAIGFDHCEHSGCVMNVGESSPASNRVFVDHAYPGYRAGRVVPIRDSRRRAYARVNGGLAEMVVSGRNGRIRPKWSNTN